MVADLSDARNADTLTGDSAVLFISSVFSEPRGQRWGLRETLRRRLGQEGHTAWLYEIDAEKDKKAGIVDDKTIIIRAIERSDFVVVLYMNREGTAFPSEPFFGTDFEIFHARRLGKPVKLYVLGKKHRPVLRGILTLFDNPLVLPDSARRFESEKDLVDAVIQDVTEFVRSRRLRSAPPGVLCASSRELVSEPSWLEEAYAGLCQATQVGDLWVASRVARMIPWVESSGIPREQKIVYAIALSLCGGVWANQASYDFAEAYARSAVRVFMELGYQHEMFAQVQALSGLLNMGNRIRQAYWINSYGLRGASRVFGESDPLVRAFHDSRGSIFTKLGKSYKAERTLHRSLPPKGSSSPYSLSKYAVSLASLPGVANVERGVCLMYYVTLPLALRKSESLAYVMRDAGQLAIVIGDYRQAARLLLQAEEICVKQGQIHTLSGIRRMQSYLALVCGDNSY